MRIREALRQAHAAGVARLDAQWLLTHLLEQPRAWLLAHDDEALPATAQRAWPALLARRAAGEPLAYVIGESTFCGLKLGVSPAVLVPRPETELLVDWALQCLGNASEPRVADLGTGSGAIALAIARAAPNARVTATDVSPDALAVAQANARRHSVPLEFALGAWWAAVAGRRFDLVVSNPPYIAQHDHHLAALSHEPRLALTAGAEGLDALQAIVAGSPPHLRPGAWLLLEHGHDQASAVQAFLTQQGFELPETRLDLANLPRCTGARWPAAK
jgi:release factor glutamine methyltransferase